MEPILLEKTTQGGAKYWELQIDTETRIPCTEEEIRTYGAISKRGTPKPKPTIMEVDFADGGHFYRGHFYTASGLGVYEDYKTFESAKKSLINFFTK